MSFGRPPSIGENFKVNPPQRGSFPLDHEAMAEQFSQPSLFARFHRRLQDLYDGVPRLPQIKWERQWEMQALIEAVS
ncbi:hypothetical protein QFC20_001843 [Naganishia adeliensis]|uniref:Uncharacterized protein n=1 Tax=Naganishia adeliensis TaxID=92952 RepID=A0ACC2WSI5_9TREE|nr:hypothetical protein QFC20_001843 [Naganishia adeliensis]